MRDNQRLLYEILNQLEALRERLEEGAAIPKTKVALRGSFEDVVAAHSDLLNLLLEDEEWREEPDKTWVRVEGLLDRAFCGFTTPRLRKILAVMRRHRLYRRRIWRLTLLRAILNAKDTALRKTFTLSRERFRGKGIEWEG